MSLALQFKRFQLFYLFKTINVKSVLRITPINFNTLINASKDQIAILDKDFKYLNLLGPTKKKLLEYLEGN